MAAYTTWLADPYAVKARFNGTVKPPVIRKDDLLLFTRTPQLAFAV